MIRHATSIDIHRPPGAVFAALLDLPGYDQWTEMVDSRWTSEGAPGVGTRGEFTMTKWPLKGTFRVEVVDLQPDRRVAFETSHPALRWRSLAVVEPADGGTRLDYSGELSFRGWRRLLEPLFAGEVQSGERREVERLKALLERSA
jgi:hypothetical protein